MAVPSVGVVSEIVGAPVAAVLLTPVPVRATGTVPALVTMFSVADNAPTAVGSNVTVIVQPNAGTSPAQVVVRVNDAVEAASTPAMAELTNDNVPPPVLVNVIT